MKKSLTGITKPRTSHIWERDNHDWYQEPPWVSARLLDVERFVGVIWDPCCGGGNILKSAAQAGLVALGSDVVVRYDGAKALDFLTCDWRADNIVCNPPFAKAQQFAELAVERVKRKAAMLFPVRRLNAARWLHALPLARAWLLTPRPSRPPGDVIARGEKPGGGTVDFCWLVFDRNHKGPAALKWLNRDSKDHVRA
jgi:hypothetical protein